MKLPKCEAETWYGYIGNASNIKFMFPLQEYVIH